MKHRVRIFLYTLAIIPIVAALCFTPLDRITLGFQEIINQSEVLLSDYIAIGGLGATLMNVGLVMLISLFILDFSKAEMNGSALASIFLMGSFAFFGKNIFNILPILCGTYLYSRVTKEPYKDIVHMSLLATSLAPMFSEVLNFGTLAFPIRFIIAFIVAGSIGFIIKPVTRHLFRVHEGFNLYNTGFAVGILATLYVSLFKSYGYQPKSRMVLATGMTQTFAVALSILFIIFLILGILQSKDSGKQYRQLLKANAYDDRDYLLRYGFGATLINMAVNGFLSLFYVLVIAKGELNGPIIGGILTVVGFSGLGKHAFNIIPIFVGVILGSLTKSWSLDQPSSLLAALFGTALAPIAGKFGFIWGVIASYINSSVALNSGSLHAGINLYNTGFSVGIVTAVLVPLLKKIYKMDTDESPS